MLEGHVHIDDDMDDGAAEEVLVHEARGGKPATRATAPLEGPAAWEQPRDRQSGKFVAVDVALENSLVAIMELGRQLKVAVTDLKVAQDALASYERRSLRAASSLGRKAETAETKAASAQARAEKSVASTVVAKDIELGKLQDRLSQAQQKLVAAHSAKAEAERGARREARLRAQAERRQGSAEKQVAAEKRKREKSVGDAEAKTERMRALKNAANSRAREAEKKASRMLSLLGSKEAMVELLQEKLGGEQADNAGLAMENEDKAGEVRELQQTVEVLEGLLDGESKSEYERLKSGAGGEPTVCLWRELGLRGERYSQDTVELGLEIMSKALTAEQAVSVVRTFVAFEHPDKAEGKDYRIPDAGRFREWRFMLEPVSHYMAVSLIKRANHHHVAHDASTKGKRIHIYQTAVTCVLEGEGVNEEVVEVPLKFEICPSGGAAPEAQLSQDAYHCTAGREQHASLLTAKSACSDHAALSTTDALEVLKQKEIDVAAAAVLSGLEEHPEKIRPAVEAWRKMTPAERECARKLHKLGCTSHAVNLTTEASHNKTEKSTIEENMVRSRAARIITRSWERRYFVKHVSPLMTAKALDEVAASKFGGSYERGGSGGNEAEAVDGSVYAAKAMVWSRKYAGGMTAVLPAALKWKPRFLWKGYSITPMTQQKVKTMAKLGHGPKKGRTGGHFDSLPFSAAAMELRPAHRHLDGTSDLPDPSEFVRGVAQLCSSSGDQGTYYLGEWRELVAWVTKKNKALPPNEQLKLTVVPAIKGSRQSITVMLASAILRNRKTYLQYLHKIRADQSHNELVKKNYAGLQDEYMMGAVAGRSTIDVTMTQPMIPFSRSSSIGRQDVYSIMGCVGSFIDFLGDLEQNAPPPGLEKLARSILVVHPRLKGEMYDSWWEARRADLEATYALATADEHWAMASAHLQAASAPMRKTHDHNLSKDCSDLSELRHACVNTDHVESGFGAIDYVHHHTQSSMRGTFGVAHAGRLHLMQPKGEMLAKAKGSVLKERRTGGAGSEEDVQSLVKKWEYTSFKSLPREERWELLTDLQRRSKELREEWKTKIKTMNSQALKRKVDSQDDDITSAKNKALKFQKYDQTVPITSISALETLTASYRGKGQDKKYAQQLRAQLQVRQHCYEWKKSTLPKFGDKHNDQELTRLEKELRAVVVKDLGEKEAPPLAYALRPAHPAMAADAIQLQVEQLKLVSRATFDVMRLAKSGVFTMAPRKRAGGRKRAARPRKKPAAKKARRVTGAEQALVGEAFEEEAIEWMVLDVVWSQEDEEVVVHYYDIVDAANEDITEDDLREALEENEYYDCMERSTVREIKQWMKEGSITPSVTLIPNHDGDMDEDE